MGCSWLLVLGLVLKVAHCLEAEVSSAEIPVISQNATGVLGDTVYLHCAYLGEEEVLTAEWRRQINPKDKPKRLAGFINGKPFGRDDFSLPVSLTNLTVQMKLSSVNAEGEYFCEFALEKNDVSSSVFVTVLVQPDIQIVVNEETTDATHYQSVSCSAIGGRPAPQISWLIGGLPPSDSPFSVNVSETPHSNGTFTLSSILHFPTHLQDEDSVTCVVQHPTFPNPKLTTVNVETYARPNVTIKAEMIQQGGNDFWVVSCISSRGRPETDISLALEKTEKLQKENDKDSGTQRLSVHLNATNYEGQSITCVFSHPKFTQVESRAVILPVFYLSGVEIHSKVGVSSDDFQGTKYLELQEELRDAVISLKVMGNVPRYQVICKKDDGPLPEGVKLHETNLTFCGPVEPQHAGLYECDFSYQHLNATLRLNITVKPQTQQLIPPTIHVDLRNENGLRKIECVAADAVPAANMSWLLPEDVSADFWFNSTTSNGSHSIRGVLLLPVCMHWELTAECVINHAAFEEPEIRSTTLPLCARPNITIISSNEWKDGHKYTTVRCSAVGVAPAAVISWHAANNSISSVSETKVQAEGLVSAQSSVHFLSSLYAGQNLTCIVKHLSLETPERQTVHIPVHKPPRLSVSVVKQHDSSLWQAVCDCRGEGVGTNLAWVLPENTRGETSLKTKYEGHVMKARLIYQFPLALHEGQNLTCVHQIDHRITEKKTVHIPKYYISSLRVLNHTTPLQSRHSDQPVIYRLSVHETHHDQKILLRAEGNVPEYSINCRRSDGSVVQMNGAAVLIQPGLSGQDNLYTCWASYYHHTATVNIQVEVTRQDEQLMLVTMISIPSASAILILIIVILCVCCKRNNRTHYKQRESLSALTALMQDPGSPEVKKPAAAAARDNKDYAQSSYSIIIDIKSKV